MSDLNSLIQLVKTFCDDRDWDQFHNPKDLAIGIVTEASELLDIMRFKSEKEISEKISSDPLKTKINDELADVLFFLLRFSQMNNIDLELALKAKLEKNAEKYPVEKSKGSNKKYNE